MAVLKRAIQGDTVESLIMDHYGKQSDELLDLVMQQEQNKHLCTPDAPLVLDSRIQVFMPDLPANERPRTITPDINLWD